MPPLVAQVFVPLSTHSSAASSKTARVLMLPTSEPASGSDEQKAATLTSFSSPNICGTHSAVCSGVPLATMATAASVVPTMARPIPASPQKISSMATGIPSPLASNHWVEKKSKEYSPTLAASWMTGHGVCFALVPLGGGGTDHVVGELVHPLAHLRQVIRQLEGEVSHRQNVPGTGSSTNASDGPSAFERSAGWLAFGNGGAGTGWLTGDRQFPAGQGDTSAAARRATRRAARRGRHRDPARRQQGIGHPHRERGRGHEADHLPAFRRPVGSVSRARDPPSGAAHQLPAHCPRTAPATRIGTAGFMR